VPGLTWKLYTARHGDPHEHGEPMPANLVEAADLPSHGMGKIVRITAPGGMMFLEVTGRGAQGERCPPSWIRIAAFPGWGGERKIERLVVGIPTCQASSADMVKIDAGDFIYGGPGDLSSKNYGQRDYTLPEQTLSLPSFSMDRTEVSNARFAAFKELEGITGYPAPTYPSKDPLHAHDAEPGSPVTYVDAFQAEAFCRYLGKQLPTDRQWMKAVRGGLVVHGKKNTTPSRTYPWGPVFRPGCVNEDRAQDAYPWVAPVDSFACGASPYGILNLVGNVQEWIARADQPPLATPELRILRGGGMDSPPDLEHTTTLFINQRGPRDFNYSVGFRCISDH
jgi:formylglycine-generating enzyme required for sulfatase activity